MSKFAIMESDYNKFLALFKNMTFKADDFVPTTDEMYDIVLRDPQNYIIYLLWIIHTGYKTEENEKTRSWIRSFLDKNLDIIHDPEETDI